jgi:tyrosinase
MTGRGQGNVLPREDIETFSKDPQKVARLRRAVRILQERSKQPLDITSWDNIVAIHGISENDPLYKNPNVPTEQRKLWNQCHGVNNEPLFFLWHRAYIWCVEQLMRSALGVDGLDFRLPYWNWYVNPSLPKIFLGKSVDGKDNPLFSEKREPRLNEGHPVWNRNADKDKFQHRDFLTFQRLLNEDEHKTIHTNFGPGSDMRDLVNAARDPIFFLHHANVDRLLAAWVKASSDNKVPEQFKDWDPTRYRFPKIVKGKVIVHEPSIKDLNLASPSPIALGYTYDNLSQPKELSPTLPNVPVGNFVSGKAVTLPLPFALTRTLSRTGTLMLGAGTVVALPIDKANSKGLEIMAGGKAPPLMSLVVVIDGITRVGPGNGVSNYKVFLNLPAAASLRGNYSDHYLGTIGLFALGHGHGGHAQAKSLRFEIKGHVASLAGRKKFSPSDIQISIVPTLAPGASPISDPVIQIGEIRLEGGSLPNM